MDGRRVHDDFVANVIWGFNHGVDDGFHGVVVGHGQEADVDFHEEVLDVGAWGAAEFVEGCAVGWGAVVEMEGWGVGVGEVGLEV